MSVEDGKLFAGDIPRLYETYLVPLIFGSYSDDLARRVAELRPGRVLEVAAGTGVLTRALAKAVPRDTAIVATDLNDGMLREAASIPVTRPIEWRQADALQLPFADASFDVIVCQFGVMFFPDKPHAFGEARRVLAPGGTYVFSVWDPIEDNEFADAVTDALAALFPADPPRFLARTPHGYCDPSLIERDLANGGFTGRPRFDTLTVRSHAASARVPAVAYCQGTPLRNEIEARDPRGLATATDRAAAAIAARFGDGAIDGRIQAKIVTVRA